MHEKAARLRRFFYARGLSMNRCGNSGMGCFNMPAASRLAGRRRIPGAL
jgi:hypothetical protein